MVHQLYFDLMLESAAPGAAGQLIFVRLFRSDMGILCFKEISHSLTDRG